MTKQKAFLRCIGWAKHLVESGYKVISTKRFETYVESLTENATKIYGEIKANPIDEISSDNNMLVKDYAPKHLKK